MIIGLIKYCMGMFLTTLLIFLKLHWKDVVNKPDFGGNNHD